MRMCSNVSPTCSVAFASHWIFEAWDRSEIHVFTPPAQDCCIRSICSHFHPSGEVRVGRGVIELIEKKGRNRGSTRITEDECISTYERDKAYTTNVQTGWNPFGCWQRLLHVLWKSYIWFNGHNSSLYTFIQRSSMCKSANVVNGCISACPRSSCHFHEVVMSSALLMLLEAWQSVLTWPWSGWLTSDVFSNSS